MIIRLSAQNDARVRWACGGTALVERSLARQIPVAMAYSSCRAGGCGRAHHRPFGCLCGPCACWLNPSSTARQEVAHKPVARDLGAPTGCSCARSPNGCEARESDQAGRSVAAGVVAGLLDPCPSCAQQSGGGLPAAVCVVGRPRPDGWRGVDRRTSRPRRPCQQRPRHAVAMISPPSTGGSQMCRRGRR